MNSVNTKCLLAIFAHPDDETFRCGGTLSLLAKHGVRVHLLTFTCGQAGVHGNLPICSRSELGEVRARELICACDALGLQTPTILGYEDGKLMDANQEDCIAQIIFYIQKYRPQVLLTWPPNGLSGHPDHIAVSQWTASAYLRAKEMGLEELSALYFLAVPETLANDLGMKQLYAIPDDEVTVTNDIESVWQEKMAAIKCHQTQAAESPILFASEEKKKKFLGYEHFYRAYANAPEDFFENYSQDFKEKQ